MAYLVENTWNLEHECSSAFDGLVSTQVPNAWWPTVGRLGNLVLEMGGGET